MFCFVRINNNEPEGWIIANDIDEARRMAYSAGEDDLASALYQMYEPPRPGKYKITDNIWMIVQ